MEAQMDAPRGKPKGPHMKEVHRLEQELVNGSMTLKAKNGAVKVVTAKELTLSLRAVAQPPMLSHTWQLGMSLRYN